MMVWKITRQLQTRCSRQNCLACTRQTSNNCRFVECDCMHRKHATCPASSCMSSNIDRCCFLPQEALSGQLCPAFAMVSHNPAGLAREANACPDRKALAKPAETCLLSDNEPFCRGECFSRLPILCMSLTAIPLGRIASINVVSTGWMLFRCQAQADV